MNCYVSGAIMTNRKVTGRTIVVDDEVYLITCDKAWPRHYTVAAIFLLAMTMPQLLRAGKELDALLYAAFIGLATLGLAWLFDDRDRYRLRHVMNLSMPKASSEPEET